MPSRLHKVSVKQGNRFQEAVLAVVHIAKVVQIVFVVLFLFLFVLHSSDQMNYNYTSNCLEVHVTLCIFMLSVNLFLSLLSHFHMTAVNCI